MSCFTWHFSGDGTGNHGPLFFFAFVHGRTTLKHGLWDRTTRLLPSSARLSPSGRPTYVSARLVERRGHDRARRQLRLHRSLAAILLIPFSHRWRNMLQGPDSNWILKRLITFWQFLVYLVIRTRYFCWFGLFQIRWFLCLDWPKGFPFFTKKKV